MRGNLIDRGGLILSGRRCWPVSIVGILAGLALGLLIVFWPWPSPVYADDPVFTDSGQRLGDLMSETVILGDLDGDGDLDALVGNSYQEEDKVWRNNGDGTFTEVAALPAYGGAAALGDLDGDGDLDVLTGSNGGNGGVWWNDGEFVFTEATGPERGQAVALVLFHITNLDFQTATSRDSSQDLLRLFCASATRW
jgi:hypothetical protein